MKKSTKCAVLLAVLLLFSAGVNSIFIATTGGRMAKQTQQVEREGWTSQRTAAVECMREAEHCSPAVR